MTRSSTRPASTCTRWPRSPTTPLHATTHRHDPRGRRGQRSGRHQGRHVRLPERRQVLDRLRPDRSDPGCGPWTDLDPDRASRSSASLGVGSVTASAAQLGLGMAALLASLGACSSSPASAWSGWRAETVRRQGSGYSSRPPRWPKDPKSRVPSPRQPTRTARAHEALAVLCVSRGDAALASPRLDPARRPARHGERHGHIDPRRLDTRRAASPAAPAPCSSSTAPPRPPRASSTTSAASRTRSSVAAGTSGRGTGVAATVRPSARELEARPSYRRGRPSPRCP